MEQQVKQVPYGVADFATVMTQNLYYVDKTMFLPELEKQPTPLQGTYQVLFLDFSQITGKIDVLEERFNAYLCIKLDSFVQMYAAYYGDETVSEIKSKTEYADKFQLIFDAAKANQFKLYLIIDEYDNFTNVVLNEHGEKVYHAITHADGFYRDVFKKFKGNFERIFMMGVGNDGRGVMLL